MLTLVNLFVQTHLSGALDVGNLELPRQCHGFLRGDSTLVLQIRLVGDHQHREHVAVLHAEDLFVEPVQGNVLSEH